jgi:hypothetical protein
MPYVGGRALIPTEFVVTKLFILVKMLVPVFEF